MASLPVPERITRDDVIKAIGPVDDATIVEIIDIGATVDELAEAPAQLREQRSRGDRADDGVGKRPPELLGDLERERLRALGVVGAQLLHVLMLPDFDRADAIGSYWGNPKDPHLRRAADRLRGGHLRHEGGYG